jgi:hypothetical protein
MSDSEEKDNQNIPAFLLEDEGPEAGTLYRYRDFSNMPVEPDNEEDNSSQGPRGNLESSIRVQKFPVKLYAILGTKEFHEIVSLGHALPVCFGQASSGLYVAVCILPEWKLWIVLVSSNSIALLNTLQVCWMPHGRSWKVLKPNLFESMVMPLFFEYSNYHSFNRLVNAWSFRRISSGPDRGSYYHEVSL